MYDRNIFGSSSVVFGNRRQALVIFVKCSKAFVWPSEQFWKIFENLRKVVGNLRKIVRNVVISMFYNKQNITGPLVDTNFIYSC